MRMKKPVRAVIDQVRITRDGNDVIIDYADPEISGTRVTIGPQLKTMTDRDVVDGANSRTVGTRRSPFCAQLCR
jgi:hypothetical protein